MGGDNYEFMVTSLEDLNIEESVETTDLDTTTTEAVG